MGQIGRTARWVIGLYVAGIVLDLAFHVALDLGTGDHKVSIGEFAVGWQASLFWPVDLLFRLLLLLR